MKKCQKCSSDNPDDAKFCRQCGRAFVAADPAAPPADATVRWQGQKHSAAKMVRSDVPLAELFGTKERLVIGRAEDCDICLPHPLVSRYHALAERRPEGLRLRDLASINGVWVNGKRVKEPILLAEGDRVGIGPFLFTLRGGVIHAVDNSIGLRLEARGLEKSVPVPGGTRKLLDDINLVVNPGEFVTILGPSGCGKSTLMDCLNGRRRATRGKVLANGEDFYRHFNNFRQLLGYVPQKDIVHGGLSVSAALLYTARLRLPTDTSRDELRERVEKVITEMELGPHSDTLIERLSGGQIKRVSLGAELLARPSLLYIDEATSGLDAGTEAKMMRLFRRLSEEGRSIICITHALENVDQCHLILVLARGKMIYYGPPAEAPAYFKVKRISDIYDRIGEREPQAWSQDYLQTTFYRELIVDRLAATPEPIPTPMPVPASAPVANVGNQTIIGQQAEQEKGATGKPLADRIRELTASALDWHAMWRPLRDGFRQFFVLTARYLELLWNDRRSLALQLLQAPIVALIILIAFYDKDYAAKIPVPRAFDQEERKALNALKDLRQATLTKTGEAMSPEKEKVLAETEVVIKHKDVDIKITALEMMRTLEAMHHLGADKHARAVLDDMKLSFGSGEHRGEVTRKEVESFLARARGSDLIDRLAAYTGPVIPIGEMTSPRYTYMLLFIIVVVVMWFGCNNASKEIVKEEAIYARERAVNLGILPYLASKFLVQVVLTLVQILLLLVSIFGVMQILHAVWPDRFTLPPTQPLFGSLPPGEMPYMLDYGSLLLVLFLLGLGGVALGLALSACVNTPDRANSLLPYVMIPQLIFGGGIMSVGTGLLYFLSATFSSVYWAFRAVHLNANALPSLFPGWVPYADTLSLPCLALLMQTAVLLMLTVVFLRQKDA